MLVIFWGFCSVLFGRSSVLSSKCQTPNRHRSHFSVRSEGHLEEELNELKPQLTKADMWLKSLLVEKCPKTFVLSKRKVQNGVNVEFLVVSLYFENTAGFVKALWEVCPARLGLDDRSEQQHEEVLKAPFLKLGCLGMDGKLQWCCIESTSIWSVLIKRILEEENHWRSMNWYCGSSSIQSSSQGLKTLEEQLGQKEEQLREAFWMRVWGCDVSSNCFFTTQMGCWNWAL